MWPQSTYYVMINTVLPSGNKTLSLKNMKGKIGVERSEKKEKESLWMTEPFREASHIQSWHWPVSN